MQKKIYWIEGDGIGAEVFQAAKPILDSALKLAYNEEHSIEWAELLAGEKAKREVGEPLPENTLLTLKTADVAIKGPLATPIGKGMRSLNVALRQIFDLYACIRPIKYYKGLETPVKHPERVDITIFRENTEDVYAGIEYAANSVEARKLIAFLHDEFKVQLSEQMAIGIKPMSEFGSKRLVRAAIKYAIKHNLPSLTLVHKGNIMKFTEGAFRQWGYDVCTQEFSAHVCLEKDQIDGKIIIKDRIADAMFQEALLCPEDHSVIATSNLNGDYLSDALVAQVGGLGLAPGVNMSDTMAMFEATHGTAPNIAGLDKANPCSVILSGAMMLEHLGWNKAAELVKNAVMSAIAEKAVTCDISSYMKDARTVGCKEFGDIVGQKL